MQTSSMFATAEDRAYHDLRLVGCDLAMPTAAQALHRSVAAADRATILVGFADRYAPEIVLVPVRTWRDFDEVDPVSRTEARRDRFDRS